MGGLFSSTSFDPDRDIPSLAGKVIIVTGAKSDSGIGYHTVKHLVRHGATVWMACRNESKAESARLRLDKEMSGSGLTVGHNGVGQVKILKCDLSSVAGSKAAAAEFMSKELRLDILINNAGALQHPFSLNEDGLSTIMATNHLGPFVFTNTLLPLLSKTAVLPDSDVRIVNLSSETHRYFVPAHLQFKTIDDFNIKIGSSGMNDLARYAISKLETVLFTAELQHLLDSQEIPILTTCLHPGTILTEGAEALFKTFPSFFSSLWFFIAAVFFISPDQGSYTTLFAATSQEIRSHPGPFRGRYMVPYGKPVDSTSQGEDRQLARDLWQLSESLANRSSND